MDLTEVFIVYKDKCAVTTTFASVFWAANMDAGEDQNTGTTNGNPQTSGNSRPPQIAHMSLYERQAVQVSAWTNAYM